MEIPSHLQLEPAPLWRHFYHLTQLPRPSKHEDKVRQHLLALAERTGHRARVDEVGNVVIYVPASKGKEGATPVIIQNHMDMVTDAGPDISINFHTDPITTRREGDWIKASGTTLGADNGIGCAAAMALLEDKALVHPPLELLFTIDEETGLKGAWGVDGSFFEGKRLLNLDTEEWGSFYIGCAGGIDYELEGELGLVDGSFSDPCTLRLTVSGFKGGHSGVDIHQQRGNAIKFLAHVLTRFSGEDFLLTELRAGKAHNIIPRDAWARLVVEKEQVARLEEVAHEVRAEWLGFLPSEDQGLALSFEVCDDESRGLGGADLRRVLAFLSAFPHGAHSFDLASQRELVALSNNLALCYFVKGRFYVLSSLRFFDRHECRPLEAQVQALGALLGLKVTKHGEYPSWKPVRENRLLDQMCAVYQRQHGKAPRITAIHAGLECGILRDRIGPVDAVSFGPTIVNAHSPDEAVHIPSVTQFWQLFVSVLAEI